MDSITTKTTKSGVSKASISKLCKEFSNKCQRQSRSNPDNQTGLELIQENQRLREELEEAKKEISF